MATTSKTKPSGSETRRALKEALVKELRASNGLELGNAVSFLVDKGAKSKREGQAIVVQALHDDLVVITAKGTRLQIVQTKTSPGAQGKSESRGFANNRKPVKAGGIITATGNPNSGQVRNPSKKHKPNTGRAVSGTGGLSEGRTGRFPKG